MRGVLGEGDDQVRGIHFGVKNIIQRNSLCRIRLAFCRAGNRLEPFRKDAIARLRLVDRRRGKRVPAYLTCTTRSSHGSFCGWCGRLRRELATAGRARIQQTALPTISSESLPRVRVTNLSTTRTESCGASDRSAAAPDEDISRRYRLIQRMVGIVGKREASDKNKGRLERSKINTRGFRFLGRRWPLHTSDSHLGSARRCNGACYMDCFDYTSWFYSTLTTRYSST